MAREVPAQDPRLGAIPGGPSAPPGTAPTTFFNHYSLLRTTEEMLGLPKLGKATAAASMRGSFNLD